jgi:hypothetical protein
MGDWKKTHSDHYVCNTPPELKDVQNRDSEVEKKLF